MDNCVQLLLNKLPFLNGAIMIVADENWQNVDWHSIKIFEQKNMRVLSNRFDICLLYTSPSPRDLSTSRMPSSA